ncbi:MAG: Hpt domain-containing protein [Bacteroidetes bacterium]|nr:Hpt domain-containing protein [Bacteroidota bacterium]
MINRVDFQEAFSYYDKEVVIEIIDLFLETYKPLLNKLQKAISAGDPENVIMHAHSIKGLAGTFTAPAPHVIAASLEEKAHNRKMSEIPALYSELKPLIEEMAADLEDIRSRIQNGRSIL